MPLTQSSASGASASGTAIHSPRTVPSPFSEKRARPRTTGAPCSLEVCIVKARQPPSSASVPPDAPWLVQVRSKSCGANVETGVARPAPNTTVAADAWTAVPISAAETTALAGPSAAAQMQEAAQKTAAAEPMEVLYFMSISEGWEGVRRLAARFPAQRGGNGASS